MDVTATLPRMAAPPQQFTVTGTLAPFGEITIGWVEGRGFIDPTGQTEFMIKVGRQVCGTATGPCFTAADRPGHVALLTARQALDEFKSQEGGDAFLAELERMSTVPSGAES